MIEYFNEQEFNILQTKRRKMIVFFSIISAIYLLIIVAIMIVFASLPYKDKSEGILQFVSYTISSIFVVFLFFYIGLKFKIVNLYYKMLFALKNKPKYTASGKFLSFERDLETKNGVDVKRMVFSVYNESRKDWFDRFVFVPYEQDFPNFNEGDMVTFLTQDNMLYSYEITAKSEKITED